MNKSIERLREVIRHLRGENGCNWDKKQKIDDFIRFAHEELDELQQACDRDDIVNLREELGDVLCQVVFIGEICEENRWFDLSESVSSITEKLIRRHPHIFDSDAVEELDSDQVVKLWDDIKAVEKSRKDYFIDTTVHLENSFRFAEAIQRKASAVNFDWNNTSDVLDKVQEEVSELKEILDSGEKNRIEEEFGDIIFSLINLSRFLDIDLGKALDRSSEKFISRFKKIEDRLGKNETSIVDSDFTTMDNIWDSVKGGNDKKDI